MVLMPSWRIGRARSTTSSPGSSSDVQIRQCHVLAVPSCGDGGCGGATLDVKEELHGYLRGARETLVWKLDGLSEYDIRRPLTPTGTNLLGLVKHSTATHLGYLGDVFGRTTDAAGAQLSGAHQFWAKPDESSR